MKGYIKILFAAALLAASLSCQKENGTGRNGGGSVIALRAGIEGGASLSSDTKSAYTGTTFKTGQTLGLCICAHEDTPTVFEPHLPGYGNIKVTCTNDTGDAWSFLNEMVGVDLPSLYLTSRSDSAKADIYAYTPYIEGVTNPSAIHVDFSKNQDIMRATENGVSNRNLDPTVNATIPVTLSFVHHLLSRIRFGFKLENDGSNHLLDYITIKKSGSQTTPIYSEGMFNCMVTGSGGIVAVEADSVRVTFGGTDSRYENYGLFSNASDYTYFDFMIYPTDYAADDDLTVVFSIDGFRHEYPIKRADLLHSDGTTYGFKMNYSYDFHFKFDNYVHLQDITVQSGWTPDTLEDIL